MPLLDELFQQFLRERRYLKNVTTKTIVWYETAWQAFQRSRTNGSSQEPNGPLINRSDLQQFVVHLRERGVKPVTCNTWLKAIQAFCRWLHEEGKIPSLIKIPPQRLEKRLIPTHGEAALRALLTFRAKDFSQQRVHALIATILDTGCADFSCLTIFQSAIAPQWTMTWRHAWLRLMSFTTSSGTRLYPK